MKYKVDIIDEKFETSYRVFSKTAIVTFFDNKGEKSYPKVYGYLSIEQIHNEINSEGETNFNQCYLNNFSLSDYRKTKGLKQNDYIESYNFSALDAFFDCKDDIDFSYSNFTGKINFAGSIFNGNIDFNHSIFDNTKLNFSNCEFGNLNMNFDDVKFIKGDIDFYQSSFGNGRIGFIDTKFIDMDISFKAFQGSGDVSFLLSNFDKGHLSFYGAKTSNITFIGCDFNNFLNFNFSKCNVLRLNNSIIRDIIDFRSLIDFKVNVDLFVLDLRKSQNLGIINIDWEENKVKDLINNQNLTTHIEKAEQFRILKENFHKLGQYDDEDKAYVEFRKHEMKALLEKRIKGKWFNRIWAYPFYWISFFVKDWLGSYGTNPWRVLANMGIFYSLFSAIYFCLLKFNVCGINPSNFKVDVLTNFYKAFYHSAITFLTIGYGDYYPSGIIRIFSGIEGFIGLFLMAYFVVAFSRKVLR